MQLEIFSSFSPQDANPPQEGAAKGTHEVPGSKFVEKTKKNITNLGHMLPQVMLPTVLNFNFQKL